MNKHISCKLLKIYADRDAILPDLGEMMICMYIYTLSPINFVEKTKWYELKRKNQFSKYVPHFIANDIAM